MKKTKPLIVGNVGKNINVKTFKGVTSISVDGDVTGEIKLRVPTNLRAVVENTTSRIDKCEEIIDKLIIPTIVQSDYERTLTEVTLYNKGGEI